jgi:large subunit ribosomal protein L31
MRTAELFGARGVSMSFAKAIRVSRHVKVSSRNGRRFMKKDIHPASRPVCFCDISTGKRFLTTSTLHSKNKETIDGVEYDLIYRDVTSASHPTYTGEKRFVDTAGRVEKFQNKFQRRRS